MGQSRHTLVWFLCFTQNFEQTALNQMCKDALKHSSSLIKRQTSVIISTFQKMMTSGQIFSINMNCSVTSHRVKNHSLSHLDQSRFTVIEISYTSILIRKRLQQELPDEFITDLCLAGRRMNGCSDWCAALWGFSASESHTCVCLRVQLEPLGSFGRVPSVRLQPRASAPAALPFVCLSVSLGPSRTLTLCLLSSRGLISGFPPIVSGLV